MAHPSDPEIVPALPGRASCSSGQRRFRRAAALVAPLALLLSAPTCGGDERDASLPHVVVVSIDTLRADALIGDGARRARTPTIDALAAGGLLLTNAHSHVPLTLPSHSTLFTGRLPTTLGLHDNAPLPLRRDIPTLATLLDKHGFATSAVIGGEPLARGSGFERGFEQFDDPVHGTTGSAAFGERNAAEVTERAIAAWRRPVGGRRRFLFAHYFDPHQPYSPPPEFVRGDPFDATARYLGEIAYVDHELARLVAELRSSGEPVLFFLTSDHGEGLGDHGERTHGYQLFESTLHVPMLFAAIRGDATAIPAELARARVARDRLVGMTDILPTLLDELAIAPPDGIDGRSLAATAPADPHCYVESLAAALHFGWAQSTGVRGDGATLLRGGSGVPDTIEGLSVEHGPSDETWLIDPDRVAPDDAARSNFREALLAARARSDALPTEGPAIEPLTHLGYLAGSADRARHALLPLEENARRRSPIAERRAIEQLIEAVAQLGSGDAAGAERALGDLLTEDGDNRAALFHRARARLELEEKSGHGVLAKSAAADLAHLIELEPEFPGARMLHAKALGLSGDFESALAELARWMVEATGDASAERLLGSLLLTERAAGRTNPRFDLEEGYGHLVRSLELDPDQARLAADVETGLNRLAAQGSPPPWIAPLIGRAKRRRGRRYRRGKSR